MTLADSQKALRTPERMADFLRHRYGLVLALDVAQGYVSERPRFWKKVIGELNTDADTAERYWNPDRATQCVPHNLIDIDVLPLNRATYNLARFMDENPDWKPPVRLQRKGKGRYKLKDGRHRYLASKLIGRGCIWARYSEAEPRRNPSKGKVVATSYTKTTHLPEAKGNYEDMLTTWYEEDLVPKYGEKKGRKISRKQAKKQITTHTFLTDLLRKYVKPGARVGSPGAGFCHEAAVAPEYQWICLEYQPELVNLSKQRNKTMGLKAQAKQWSAFEGDVEACQEKSCFDLLGNLGPIPKVDAIYLKHFCGGGTDSVLYSAVHQKVPVIILMTCCADRYPGLSHAILAPEWSFKHYRQIAKESQDRRTDKGLKAVALIDDLRAIYLKKHGYKVERGWRTDAQGKLLPSGSWMVATLRKGKHTLRRNAAPKPTRKKTMKPTRKKTMKKKNPGASGAWRRKLVSDIGNWRRVKVGGRFATGQRYCLGEIDPRYPQHCEGTIADVTFDEGQRKPWEVTLRFLDGMDDSWDSPTMKYDSFPQVQQALGKWEAFEAGDDSDWYPSWLTVPEHELERKYDQAESLVRKILTVSKAEAESARLREIKKELKRIEVQSKSQRAAPRLSRREVAARMKRKKNPMWGSDSAGSRHFEHGFEKATSWPPYGKVYNYTQGGSSEGLYPQQVGNWWVSRTAGDFVIYERGDKSPLSWQIAQGAVPDKRVVTIEIVHSPHSGHTGFSLTRWPTEQAAGNWEAYSRRTGTKRKPKAKSYSTLDDALNAMRDESKWDDGIQAKPKRGDLKRKKAAAKKRAAARNKAQGKKRGSSKTAITKAEAFKMSKTQLCAIDDKACRAEVKRRAEKKRKR